MFRHGIALSPPTVVATGRAVVPRFASWSAECASKWGVPARCTLSRFKVDVAPGVGSLVPPDTSAFSAPPAASTSLGFGSLEEVTGKLKARQNAQGTSSLQESMQIVERGLQFAASASLQEIADFAECLVHFRLRLPLRDLLPVVAEKLKAESPGTEALPSIVRLLNYSGKGTLFYPELFEFCNQHLDALKPNELALYMYEAGRHGLRCRHFIDAAVRQTARLAPQMGAIDLMRTSQGLVRFSRDWKEFFVAARPHIVGQVNQLSNAHLLLVLRFARNLRHLPGFVDLHAACCTELMLKSGSLTLQDMAQALMACGHDTRFQPQAQGLVRCIEQELTRREDISGLRVAEVVDALECFASWKSLRPTRTLIQRLDEILVERQVELKYAGNISLWVTATDSFAKMEVLDATWPLVALELSRDALFIERTSFFLHCTLIAAFGRLRLFDEVVYENIANLLVSDFELFKNAQDMAPVLWTYAMAGFFHERLFDAAYDRILEWFEEESLDVSRRASQNAFLQIVWSFVVAGYHIRYQSFAAFLDYAFFGRLLDARPLNVKRLAEIADAVLLEAPGVAALSQFRERLEASRDDQHTRKTIRGAPPADPQLLQELCTALQDSAWPYEAGALPEEGSAFCIDISLAPKLGEKAGFMLAGPFELYRVGLPDDSLPRMESGHLRLARRLLGCRGWRTAVISRESWESVGGELQDRQRFLEDGLRLALRGAPLGSSAVPTEAAAPALS